MTINKHSKLRALDGYKAFCLGQLEGNAIRSMAKQFNNIERDNDVIAALNAFEFTQKIYENYAPIMKHKDDVNFIANYLCAINWMAHFYSDMCEDRPVVKEVLSSYHLLDEIDYFNEAADYYCFAYNFLVKKFYNDTSIKESVKNLVYRLND